MLKERIKEDVKEALKRGEKEKVSVLRMVLASMTEAEKKKRYTLSKSNSEAKQEELEEKSQLTEEEAIEVIFSGVKKRKDAISEFEKGKRQDLVEKEKREIEILKPYLPKQLSEEEIEEVAKGVIKEVGAKNPKDMGKVMASLMPKLKGKADGKTASQIVKNLLT